MPTGPKGQKRPADAICNAVKVMRIATEDEPEDYAMLVKIYGASPTGAQGRYSPAECTGIKKVTIEGRPDEAHVSTTYMERQNLTMRKQMRRFTHFTN